MAEHGTREHLEHAEHAEHAAHAGDPFITKVSVTIAFLAVIAATIGSLETIETAGVTVAKSEAVLAQNKATDAWNFYQARSIKGNMYEIASTANPDKAATFDAQAKKNRAEQDDIKRRAEEFEKKSEAALHRSEGHEHRHHILTIAVTLLQVSIAVATLAIISRGLRWPWYGSMALGAVGVAIAAYSYIH